MRSFFGEEVDVCVVGSGAGGAPVAFELARAGASVVVLEKGPWYTREDFGHDEIGVVRRQMWVPLVEEEPHMVKGPGDAEPKRSVLGWIASCVGGGTVHMSGFFHRLHPEDFRMKSRYPNLEGATLADWPIRYEDLAPYYDRVEEEVGLSGDTAGNPFEPARARPYPLPRLEENPLAALVDRGASALGLHAYPTPRAIVSRAYKGRNACVYCDFCGSYGCEVDAKSSTLVSLIPRAVETDRCEVRPKSMAFEVGTDARGRATTVRYYDADGNAQEQRARIVVISASAIESARLLLNSRSSRFPNGLGNGSGLVGKNLTFSTLARGSAEFERAALDEALRPRHRIHFVNRSVQDLYVIPDRAGGYDKGGTMNFLLPHRGPIFAAERLSQRARPPLWGAALQAALDRHYHEVHEIEVEIFGEFLPSEATRVTVDAGTRDRWGIPVARIDLAHHPEDRATSRVLLDKALALLTAAGAARTFRETEGDTTWVLQHGTCRFGIDPATSVLDPNCRAHEVPNLYVVDGSFMPTSGGVPSTLTILANAFRVGEQIAREFRSDGSTRAPGPTSTPRLP